MKTVTTAQMRMIDARAIEDWKIPSLELMERAAAHVARAVMQTVSADAGVLILCGTGNNGGDGLACARLLKEKGIRVTVILVGNPEKLTPDARVNARRLAENGIALASYDGGSLPDCGCMVDALFGFGLNREVTGLYRACIEQMNASGVPVIACDIPSGLSGDTGKVMGIAVKAKTTVTFTCAKQGLCTPGGAEYAGQLIVADIGIPEDLLREL